MRSELHTDSQASCGAPFRRMRLFLINDMITIAIESIDIHTWALWLTAHDPFDDWNSWLGLGPSICTDTKPSVILSSQSLSTTTSTVRNNIGGVNAGDSRVYAITNHHLLWLSPLYHTSLHFFESWRLNLIKPVNTHYYGKIRRLTKSKKAMNCHCYVAMVPHLLPHLHIGVCKLNSMFRALRL